MGTLLARLTDVDAGYDGRAVLTHLTLDVVRGRQLVVLGPSGAGKSTLLKLLTREITPLRGTISFDGRDIDPESGSAVPVTEGVVTQAPELFGWLTLAENIALGLRFAANAAARASGTDRVAELVDLLGLGEVVDRYPDEVSGGQAQRASLARALAIDPDLLLLDEPFSALDPATRHELQVWLRRAAVDQGLTTVLVTHDLDEALVVGDTIVLVDRNGHLRHTWTNDRPAADASAALVHPLRPVLRRGYDADAALEPGDEEFSGFAPVGGGRRG